MEDGHFALLQTCNFSNRCPFLDVLIVSVGHIRIVYEKSFEAKRQILRIVRSQYSLVTLKLNPAQMPIKNALLLIFVGKKLYL